MVGLYAFLCHLAKENKGVLILGLVYGFFDGVVPLANRHEV